jgi:hypothetical protein
MRARTCSAAFLCPGPHLRFPEDVPHGLLPRPLRHDAVLGPFGQVVQVEVVVVLRG